jgi:hypothetical protein
MSYSNCLACTQMVGGNEKWCDKCLKEHGLKQTEDYWGTARYYPRNDDHSIKDSFIESEIEKDKL